MRRFSLLLVSLMLTLALVVAACDDDDDSATTSAEEAFCADADSLQAGVSALADLDVVAEGTNGIESAVSDVETDLQNLKESGTEVGGDELDALESSVQDLEDALSAAGEDLTTENATGVISAVADVANSAAAVKDTFAAACPE